mgnify:CR=1 FL=1
MKTKPSCLIVFFLVVIFSNPAFSQDYVDLLKISYNQGQNVPFDGDTSTARINEVAADLTIPIPVNENFVIITGVLYEGISVKAVQDRQPFDIYGIALKAGAKINHNDTWSGTYVLLPKASGDLDEFNAKDFQMGGIVVISKKVNENKKWKFGAYANSELFGPLVVPILGMYYQKNNFEANLTLPITADINWQLKSWFKTGIFFRGIR